VTGGNHESDIPFLQKREMFRKQEAWSLQIRERLLQYCRIRVFDREEVKEYSQGVRILAVCKAVALPPPFRHAG